MQRLNPVQNKLIIFVEDLNHNLPLSEEKKYPPKLPRAHSLYDLSEQVNFALRGMLKSVSIPWRSCTIWNDPGVWLKQLIQILWDPHGRGAWQAALHPGESLRRQVGWSSKEKSGVRRRHYLMSGGQEGRQEDCTQARQTISYPNQQKVHRIKLDDPNW